MIFKKIYIYHCIERTEHVLEELDISAIKVYVYYIIIMGITGSERAVSECLISYTDAYHYTGQCVRDLWQRE